MAETQTTHQTPVFMPEIVSPQERQTGFDTPIARALDRYVMRRATGQYQAERGGDGVRVEEIETSTAHDILDAMDANYTLVEHVAGVEPQQETGATICVPDAILIEDVEDTVATLRQIREGSRGVPGGVEVLLWANYRKKDDDDSVSVEAQSAYIELRRRLQEEFGCEEGFSIDAALKEFTEEEFSMSKMRQSYMDAVALGSHDKGYGFTHPVLWFDADTQQISSPDLIPELVAKIRRGDALFAHAKTELGPANIEAALSGASNAEKIALLAELQKRLLDVYRPDKEVPDDGYVEEWGWAFGVGTYLWAGGLNTEDVANEGPGLVRNMLLAPADDIKTKANRIPDDFPIQRNVDGDTILPYVITAETIRSSIRRKVQLMRQIGLKGLDERQHGSGFGASGGEAGHTTASVVPIDTVLKKLHGAAAVYSFSIIRMCLSAGLPVGSAREMYTTTPTGEQVSVLDYIDDLARKYLGSAVDLAA